MSTLAVIMTTNETVRLLMENSAGAGSVCTAILILLLLAAPLNAIIIITVFRTFLRMHIFNLLLVSYCTAVLLDAAINLPVASVFRASWPRLHNSLGDSLNILCQFSAASVQWSTILQVGCLVILTAHRFSLMSSNPAASPVKKPKYKRYTWLTVLLWAASIVFVVPILVGVVDTAYFEERYTCGSINATQHSASMASSLTILTLGCCLPYALLAVQWVVLLTRTLQERNHLQQIELLAQQRAAANGSPLRNSGNSYLNSSWQMWGNDHLNSGEGTRFIVLLASLSCLQLLLVLPGEIYNTITQFSPPYQPLAYHLLYPHTPRRFHPVITPWHDGTFTWLRFVHTIVAPCTILAIHESLRHQVREIIFSSHRNKYSQLSPVQTVTGFLNTRRAGRRKRKKSRIKKLREPFAPILLATPEGIHARYITLGNDSKLYCTLIFADLGARKSKENVKKVIYSPYPARKPLNDVMFYDEDEIAPRAKKGGKSVRFSANISEIPLRGVEVDSLSVLGGKVEAPTGSVSPLMAVLNAGELIGQSFQGQAAGGDRSTARRSSEPNFRNNLKKGFGTIEKDLANDSFASSSSSSSIILTLSQRMRQRNH